MADTRAMLVVDDEEVVCHACRRIFSRQGFEVETNTDARAGLARAAESDYEIILLDIKMPNMDGIQFLEKLREVKPDVPVLIITGYPSIPNAAAAMRLGACDYVTKPFTSEEVTWAVQRVLAARCVTVGGGPGEEEGPATPEQVVRAEAETLWWDEAWVRLAVDGSASIGAVLPGLRGATPTGVRLPRIGEVLYQGLPAASLSLAGKPAVIIPAPLSGVVIAVNDSLSKYPDYLASDPCGEGWIACLSITRHEELEACRRRGILLANADPLSADEQSQRLVNLGCHVQSAADRAAVLATLADSPEQVVVLDAASFGDEGPTTAGLINEHAPAARIVVLGSADAALEAVYRKRRIFYYAVEPFADNEIADILTAAFHAHEAPAPKTASQKEPSEPVSSIQITNRNLHKVQLMAAPGLLWANEGLGHEVGQRLLRRMLPVVITPGEAYLTPANILKMAAGNDRLMVLLARDAGLLPGSLTRDTKPEFGVDAGDTGHKVAMMTVQPDRFGGFAGLDDRTIAALADHIVWDMTSY